MEQTVNVSNWLLSSGLAIRQKYIHESREAYRVYGCCMLLKNSVMKDADCMDQRLFLYGEEDILAERMLANGYTSYYDFEVSVTHEESASVKQMSKNRKKLQIRGTEKSMEYSIENSRHLRDGHARALEV